MILEVLDRYYGWSPGKRVLPRGWTKVECPNPEHSDTIASATISIEHDRVKCFACGYRAGPVDIVMTEEDLDRDSALAFLSEEFDVDGASELLPGTAPRIPGRRVFGGGTGAVDRRRGPVRPRVFRRD